MFPVFSGDRMFNFELEVVPTRGHMTYSMILGQDTMRKLEIDTIISKNIFTWKGISRSIVARDYWSKERVKSMELIWTQYLNKSIIKEKASDNDCHTIPGLIEQENRSISTETTADNADKVICFTDNFMEASTTSSTALNNEEDIIGADLSFQDPVMGEREEVHNTQDLKAAKYKKADLGKYIDTKCNNLDLEQKGKLWKVLKKHEGIFAGKEEIGWVSRFKST